MPNFVAIQANKGFQASALPWQMKSTLIFINFLLVEFEMPRFTAFCANPFDKRNVRLSSGH